MSIPANPQAFPHRGISHGMTLRDYFAAAAVQGMLAAEFREQAADTVAGRAYEVADAMLRARQRSASGAPAEGHDGDRAGADE